MPRLLLFLLTLCWGGTVLAQPSSQKDLSEKSVPNPAAASKEKEDYSQEALVVEQLKTSYRFEKDGTGQREVRMRVRIQSHSGLEHFGQLIFPYSATNEKLQIDQVRVLKADGTTVTASTDNIQDISAPISREAPVYTDVRQKHVTVPGLRPGDTLEYRVIWNYHTPFAQSHFWFSHDFTGEDLIVLDEQLQVDIPQTSTVKLKTEKGFEPSVSEQEGRRVYSWRHAVLKRQKKDADDEESFRLLLENMENPKPPQVQLTTFQSWNQLGQWYADLERERIIPDERIRLKTQELIRGRETDQEKINALYEFVALNFRYVSLSLGVGRYQPQHATQVMTNQYGDCKDKHTLLSSMLIAAGLRAYPVLINSTRKIDPDVPSPAQFDHVISAIPVKQEIFWADTTAEIAPFRLLSPRLRDKQALLIPANGEARLETTPAEAPFKFSQFVEIKAQVNEFGKVTGHAHLSLRGDAEFYFRTIFRRTPKSEWKELGYLLSSAAGVRGEISGLKLSDPTDLAKPMEIDFDFTAENFLDWSSKKIKLPVPMPTVGLRPAHAGKEPVVLGPPTDIVYRVTMSFPSKYELRAPVPVKVNRDYADYTSVYKLEANTLTAERHFRSHLSKIPATRVQDYAAFVAAARADEDQKLSLETSVAGTPSIPDTVKIEELVASAQAALNNNNYPVAEALLRKVLEKETDHKTARRQLGYALFAQRKLDEAIEVLQAQAKLNPFDDYVYNQLGRIYWIQQKYSEAEKAFRKQIEVAPLDKWAHGNLGLMLVESRKYQDAVPELEQAISLNPEEEPSYLIGLGRALLNLKQVEKATSVFDRAVKVAPGHRTWNDVAYFLAEEKVQLDRARQYAESAVSEVSTALRNAELHGLTLTDLQNVAALGANWDTLGWVLFQKGDLDGAEKYIKAAWLLQQHGEVGYHLARIYELRGKKEEAIELYAHAAIASRTVPEAKAGLDRLVGKDKSESYLRKASQNVKNSRTIKFARGAADVKGASEAQYFVTLAPGPDGNAQVIDVRFIGGDGKLRALEANLKSASFGFAFPDEKVTKVIRRGTLFCESDSQCSFIMIDPEGVHSVD